MQTQLKAQPARHFIGNSWQAGSGASIDVRCPTDGRLLGQLAAGGAAEINAAVKAARAALEGEWGGFSPTQRGRLMLRLSELILRDADRLAWVEALDTGKPITTARNYIKVLARYFEYYGGAADKVLGQVVPFESGYSVTVTREPHGVTAHIIPWNYPVQMFGRSVAPALAMGNACVVKPAEDACLAVLEICVLAAEAGFPDGALNMVTGHGREAGATLSAHPDISYVSFTGSPQVGALAQQAAAANSVAVCLELGGKSPQIVFADADLDRAAATVVKAITQNAGQTCSADSRVLVESSIFRSFMQSVAAGFEQLKVGLPEEDADLGPVVNVETEEGALQLANGTEYGLVAAIWARNGDRFARMSRKLAAGQCFINCFSAGGGVELPFGGMKRSGHGRGKGLLALKEMSAIKTIVHCHG